MVLKKSYYQGKRTEQTTLSASPRGTQPTWLTHWRLIQGSQNHLFLVLPTFNSILSKGSRNGKTLPHNINQHRSISLRTSPLRRGTLLKSQRANQTHVKLINQLYFKKPSAFSNSSPISLCICYSVFFHRAQKCNPTAEGCAQQTGTGLQAQKLALSSFATHPLVASGKSLSPLPPPRLQNTKLLCKVIWSSSR